MSFRQYEMTWPSLSPRPPRGTLGAAALTPVFLDVNGNPITAIVCGGAYTFDVPGAPGGQIWLTMTKDNQQVYNALFGVPMPSYVSSCANDVGTYQVLAYDPVSGILLGQTTFQVLPAGSQVPTGSSTSGISAWLSSLSTPMKIGLAAVAVLLLKGKKKLL